MFNDPRAKIARMGGSDEPGRPAIKYRMMLHPNGGVVPLTVWDSRAPGDPAEAEKQEQRNLKQAYASGFLDWREGDPALEAERVRRVAAAEKTSMANAAAVRRQLEQDAQAAAIAGGIKEGMKAAMGEMRAELLASVARAQKGSSHRGG